MPTIASDESKRRLTVADSGSSGINDARFEVILKWLAAAMCALQMYYVGLESYRHWHGVSSASGALLVGYLMIYPGPLLLLMRKRISPSMTAVVVYVALGTATALIFPTAP